MANIILFIETIVLLDEGDLSKLGYPKCLYYNNLLIYRKI